ncbi:MAG: hypothetical protein V7K48_22990 [Nostoc sp.]|uniref:hypothetical protein n=1 Tax=Nostoc sp. TaxID=1180 RepID=UPI002FF441D9
MHSLYSLSLEAGIQVVSFHPLQAAPLDTIHELVKKVTKLYRAQPCQLLSDLQLQPKAVDETILTLASRMMWRPEVRSLYPA